MHSPRSALPALALSLTIALPLTGCGTTAAEPAGSPRATSTAPDGVGTALTLADGWAKATSGPMTGVFGTLTNTSATDLHLVEVRSDLAGVSEMHVTEDDGAGGRLMRRADDGFLVAAGGEHVLAPGGDHLMLMELTGPLRTGQEVTVVVVDADGGEHELTVTARAFAGAEESYRPEQTAEAP